MELLDGYLCDAVIAGSEKCTLDFDPLKELAPNLLKLLVRLSATVLDLTSGSLSSSFERPDSCIVRLDNAGVNGSDE